MHQARRGPRGSACRPQGQARLVGGAVEGCTQRGAGRAGTRGGSSSCGSAHGRHRGPGTGAARGACGPRGRGPHHECPREPHGHVQGHGARGLVAVGQGRPAGRCSPTAGGAGRRGRAGSASGASAASACHAGGSRGGARRRQGAFPLSPKGA
eukprot:9953664-Alexandrium_andersonii.AAC.1